jgi:hypothetical protein
MRPEQFLPHFQRGIGCSPNQRRHLCLLSFHGFAVNLLNKIEFAPLIVKEPFIFYRLSLTLYQLFVQLDLDFQSLANLVSVFDSSKQSDKETTEHFTLMSHLEERTFTMPNGVSLSVYGLGND